jgi:phage replication-related protein YjqB (UPF0714/DUF867 family)
MPGTSRRSILGLLAVGLPLSVTSEPRPLDAYASNTALYADPSLVEGVDYARRYRRHEMFDDSLAQRYPYPSTAVLAPHGGGIEVGTSELCLAVAGYHPGTLAATPPVYDYWMFEGLRSSDNDQLHVTSAHCDDPVALSVCGGSRHALGLHGCTPAQVDLPAEARAVLVGGRDGAFKRYLLEELAGFGAVDAAGWESLNGSEPANIANRTLLGMGGQVEITTPLRAAMFTVNTRAQRKNTTTPLFWSFVDSVRRAIARLP